MLDASAFTLAAPTVLRLVEWTIAGVAVVVLVPVLAAVALWLICCELEVKHSSR